MHSFDGIQTPKPDGAGAITGREAVLDAAAVLPDIESGRHQLEAERAACERKLEQLKADLDSNAAALERARLDMERANRGKLQFLASISPDLRTPLHFILGYGELLRRDGGLNAAQEARVNAVLDAGVHLLERVNCVLNLAEPGTDAPSGAPGLGLLADAGGNRPDAPLHVLVVDDLAMNRDIAAAFLTDAGHRVTTAEDGPQAVLVAGAGDVDVVLMDVRMPGMDGLEATRRIRALAGAGRQVPIVALTALAFAEQVEECREAGMNGHLAKPFSAETLCRAITQAAAGRAMPVAANAASLSPQSGWPVVNLAAFRRAASGVVPDQTARTPPPVIEGNADDVTPGRSGQRWIDITSPWNCSASAAALTGPGKVGRRAEDAGFVLRLASVTSKWGSRLVDARLSCEPPPEHSLTEFHWLLFAQAAPDRQQDFSAACDLWRWNGNFWRSITVPGAQFSPAELYDQGWRYCGPCADKVARVEIVPAGTTIGPGTAPDAGATTMPEKANP
jgi:CheY-like chemotaxis protein